MKALALTVSGLHLGYLGTYGCDWVATPTVDQLAAEGIVFDQHYADCPETSAAHRVWFSGRYTIPSNSISSSPDLLTPQLGQLLRSQGITTCLVTADETQSIAPAKFWDCVEPLPPAEEGTPLERTLEAVVTALDQLAEVEHWLLWAELPALLPPWKVPDEFLNRYFRPEPEEEVEDEEPLTPLLAPEQGPIDIEDHFTTQRLQNTYAAVVTYLDTGLGLVGQELRERRLLDELTLLLTTDRGLPLGEHGILGDHRPWLHEELIHLPLIVRLPGTAEAGRRIAALTQPVDLLPTLLETF